MKNILFNKFSILVLLWILPASSQARLPAQAFRNMFDYFKPGQEVYSPALGQIAIESGFIENLRFLGNIEPAYENQGQENEQRSFVKDIGQDAISNLIIKLFPSNAGALAVESLGQDNFGKYVNNPEVVSMLLNYVASCRKGKCISTIENEIRNITGITRTKQKALESLREILSNIEISLKEEGNNIYPANLTELVILSFFFEKFNNQADIFAMLRRLDNSIVDKKQIPSEETVAANPHNFLLSKEYTDFLWEKNLNDLTSSDIVALYNSWMFYSPLTPYKSGVSLLSNGQACAYDRSTDQRLTETFADCVEMAGRHIFNLLLYQPETKRFNLEHLSRHVENQKKDTLAVNERKYSKEELLKIKHPYDNFIRFYAFQTLDKANAGDPDIRSRWNEVVGNLGITQPIYCKPEKQCTYELDAGHINFINTYASLFDIAIPPLPKDWQLPEGRVWLEKSLLILFKTINPERSYMFDLNNIKIKSLGSDDRVRKELSGTIPVQVRDSSAHLLFSFDFYNAAGKHSEIRNLYANEDARDLNEVAPAIMNKNLEALSLMIENSAGYPSNFLYRSFKYKLEDNNSKIGFISNLNSKIIADVAWINKNNYAINQILKNILDKISWADNVVVNQINPEILKLSKIELQLEQKLGWQNHVQALIIDADDFNALFFKNLRKLHITSKQKAHLQINGLPELKELKVFGSDVKVLSLHGLDKLAQLFITLPTIERIEGLNSLSELQGLIIIGGNQIKELSVSGLRKLFDLIIRSGSAEKLETLHLDRLPRLGNLRIKNAPNLREIKGLAEVQNNPKFTIIR